MPQRDAIAQQNRPYWADTTAFPTFSKVDRDEHVDVLVVGGASPA